MTVDEALSLVLAACNPRPPVEVELEEALDLVLAEDIASDVDSPPHDKSIVDGYAVRSEDLAGGPVQLTVVEEIMAGQVPARQVGPGEAARIMTGAPLPGGADAVVMVERTEALGGGHHTLGSVRINQPHVAAGANVMRRGGSMRVGETILQPETILRPGEIGLLAEAGRTRVRVHPRPSVAVVSTGNELVPAQHKPGPGEIRNSNGPMLLAAVRAAGGSPTSLGIARDDPEELRRMISSGLEANVLVLSGGVSAGVLDLVPGVLKELGVRQMFHKVQLKPGKPLWFGALARSTGEKLVFGLPGNPVSSFVCFELFVRPAIARLAGRPFHGHSFVEAALAKPHLQRGDRPTFHPARWRAPEGKENRLPTVEPLPWQGSGDLRGLVAANGLAYFPPGDRQFERGEVIRMLML
ncbi:MAG: molybdopterin molybdotransferase MoeA [Planctomycetes bacterium]|nr:molybdopterin molybdotransferase MoeA [Planctomycetota bacterium]